MNFNPVRRCAAVVAQSVSLLLFAPALFAAPSVLVEGAGVAVTADDVLADAQRIPPDARKEILATPNDAAQLASNLYVRKALAAEAIQQGMDNDPIIQKQLQIARDRVLSDARLAQIDAKNKPSDATLEQYAKTTYQGEPNRFAAPEELRARHILIKGTDAAARAKAEMLLSEIKNGADFEALATKESNDPGSAAKGGDLGFFGRGKMVKPFEDAALALKNPGDLSPVVESPFGFHIIKLLERRSPGQRPYEEVRQALRTEALEKIMTQGRAAEVQRLKEVARFNQDAIEALSATAQRAK